MCVRACVFTLRRELTASFLPDRHRPPREDCAALAVVCSPSALPRAQSLTGALYFADLAGSERLGKSGATGERLKETQAIRA